MLLDSYINNINNVISSKKSTYFSHKKESGWKHLDRTDLVLGHDMGLELGAPLSKSTAFLTFTHTKDLIKDNRITLIGKEMKKHKGKSISYGKIVMVEVEEMNYQENYDKVTELSMVKHDICLEGFMLRAQAKSLKEWTRISKKAIKDGFSFEVLGSEIISAYKKLPFVKSVEVIFIANEDDTIIELGDTGEKVMRIIKALNTKFDDIEHNCKACDLEDLCDEIDGMGLLHKKSS